ncbi:MAG: hypothetical protein SWJ54_11445, partial [Cyanobacteriota bacterium]|nr:hypothetical protein [Cyanobacteriota bacterium]
FFIPSERMVQPSPGNVALVSQSGGILVDQMVKFADEGIGLALVNLSLMLEKNKGLERFAERSFLKLCGLWIPPNPKL